MPLTKRWNEHIAERLRDQPEEIPGYLNACLEEGPAAFRVGVRHVIDATTGMSEAAAKARLHRVSLYKMLGEGGNPTLASLSQVLRALDLRLAVVPVAPSRRRAQSR